MYTFTWPGVLGLQVAAALQLGRLPALPPTPALANVHPPNRPPASLACLPQHRLVAVANSLANLQTGQKMLAVGVPLAAAQLWPRPALAYSVQPAARPQPAAELELTLGQLSAMVARIAAALREELAIAMRGVFLFLLFLPAVATAPGMLLSEAHRARWLELVRWTLEQAGPAFIKVRCVRCAAGGATQGFGGALLGAKLAMSLRRGARQQAGLQACPCSAPWRMHIQYSYQCNHAPLVWPALPQWGQWAATRPDLFPQDACNALAALQSQVRSSGCSPGGQAASSAVAALPL